MPLRLPWSSRPAPLSDEEFAEFIAPPQSERAGRRRATPRSRGGVRRLNSPTAIALYLVGGLCVAAGVLGIASASGSSPADNPIDAIGRIWREVIELLTGR